MTPLEAVLTAILCGAVVAGLAAAGAIVWLWIWRRRHRTENYYVAAPSRPSWLVRPEAAGHSLVYDWAHRIKYLAERPIGAGSGPGPAETAFNRMRRG